MSDSVHCDVCKKAGRRRMFKCCPEGWFFGYAVDEDDPDDCTIIIVCSTDCQAAFFQPGPGQLYNIPG